MFWLKRDRQQKEVLQLIERMVQRDDVLSVTLSYEEVGTCDPSNDLWPTIVPRIDVVKND